MEFWQFLDSFLRNPPLWILAIFVFLLTGAALRKIAEIIGIFPKGREIELLELIMVLGLLYLIVKAQVSEGLALFPRDEAWQNQPITIIGLFAVATLLSMVILYYYKKS